MLHCVLCIILLLMIPHLTLAQTTAVSFNFDFQDGQTRGTKTTMAVPTQMINEEGNWFMRVTATPTNCSGIPADLCPGQRSRQTVTFTPSYSTMPTLSTSNMRQTYEAKIRLSPHITNRGSLLTLFQFAPGGESGGYGSINGTGPVSRIWGEKTSTTAAHTAFTSLYNNEQSLTEVWRTLAANTWYDMRIDAVWSHDPAVGRMTFYLNGAQVLDVTGRDVNLGPESSRLPEMKLGMYGDYIVSGAYVDLDDLKAYPTASGPPAPPGVTPPPPPSSGTTFHYDFEDGKLRGDPTSMQVPPKLLTEGSNNYMRITGTAGDCQSIPSDQCPPRVRATVRFSTAATGMPLLSDAVMRQTYSANLRFHQDGGNSAFELFQHAPGGETYGEQNGNGPVFRFWRTAGTVEARAAFDYERQMDKVAWVVPNDEWHNYKVVAIWSHDPAVGRLEVYYDNQLKMTVSGRDVNLGPDSDRIPEMKLGLYSNNAVGVIDVDNVQAYDTLVGPPLPPGGGTTPPPTTVKTVYISTTGSGTICTSAAPCTFATGMAYANGGDTIKLGNGTHPACDDCLKSGTSGKPTVLESWNVSGTPTVVGADHVQVYPGLATLSTSTGVTLSIPGGRHDITVRNLNITTTGASTNAALQVNTSNGTATTNIVFDNIDVQAPTRTGALSAAYIRGPTTTSRVTIRRSRFHRSGPTVNVNAADVSLNNGLTLIGPDHVVEDSDIYDNFGVGVGVWPGSPQRIDRFTFQRNRVFGNGSDGVALGPSTDARLRQNEVFANGRNGIIVGVTANRAMIYQNSLYANSRKTLTNYMGIYAQPNTVGIVRNNIAIGHPSYQYSIPATMACTDNLASGAIETSCSGMTLNAVATDVWVDPTNGTLASRDFSLVPSTSVAIDNGTAAMCTSTDTGANRCTPALTLAGFAGTAPDQGAHESSAVAASSLIADLPLANDAQDATAQNNDGTAISVTFDGTAAIFNDSADRISHPLNGLDLTRGMTVAISARFESLGSLVYAWGHSATPPNFTHRIQIKKDADDFLFVGMGDNRDALVTSFHMAANTWYRLGLVIDPPTLAGGSTRNYRVYADGVEVGHGVATTLSQLGSIAMIGNDGAQNIYGWGTGGTSQLRELRLWNYPRTAAQMADDCDTYCEEPTIPEDFQPNCGTIGDIAPNIIRCDILAGADPAVCSPLSNYQVTCAGVAQTETACTVTGTTNPQLRLTLAAACRAEDDVILTIAGFDDAFEITNLITPPTGAFDMLSGETSVNGLQVLVTLAAIPPATTCQTLSAFRVRDNCVVQSITGCSIDTAGPVRLQLTRATPPANPTVSVDVTYFPTDERIGVTNRYNPIVIPPEEPPTAGLIQAQWRFRPVGLNDAVRYESRANEEGHSSSPGAIAARIALANTSGATKTGLGTSLRCARALPGVAFSNFVPVTGGLPSDPYNAIGLRYDPQTGENLPDQTALASSALPRDAGISDSQICVYRRKPTTTAAYTLLDDQQLEEEHALEIAPNVPLGSRYVCRLFSVSGQPMDSYAGLQGCTQATGGFVSGQVPCGAPFMVRTPLWQRR